MMKFLIIKLSSLGDIIHSLPIVYRIRKQYPNSQIDWLTGNKGFEILSLIEDINKVYLLSLESICLIQKQKYDYVIDVQGLFKSALLSKLSFGKKTIGFKGARELADIFYDKKVDVGHLFKTNRHIVNMNLTLIDSLVDSENDKIRFLLPKVSKTCSGLLQHATTENLNKKLIIFPSTTWESKLWSMDYWFELIKKMSSEFQIYLCASNSDLRFIKTLIDKLTLNIGFNFCRL